MKLLLKSQKSMLIKFVFENPDVEDIAEFLIENEIDPQFTDQFIDQYLSLSELDKLSLDVGELIECVENEIQLNK